jgi:hypothetical protein
VWQIFGNPWAEDDAVYECSPHRRSSPALLGDGRNLAGMSQADKTDGLWGIGYMKMRCRDTVSTDNIAKVEEWLCEDEVEDQDSCRIASLHSAKWRGKQRKEVIKILTDLRIREGDAKAI